MIRAGKALLILGGTGLLVFGLFSGFVMLFEKTFLYHPTKEGNWNLPETTSIPVRNVSLQTSDQVRLHAWYAQSENPRFTILWLHGNAGNITNRFSTMIDLVQSHDVDVLLPDYRGYGKSEGSPSEEGFYRDADAAYQYLIQQGIPAKKIVILGISLGGGPACDLAARVPCAGLILQSTFTNIPDMASQMFPIIPIRKLVRTQFDNLAKVSTISVPKLFIHGRLDELVPFRMGEQLLEAAKEPKSSLWLEGADHNSIAQTHRASWIKAYREFLEELPAR